MPSTPSPRPSTTQGPSGRWRAAWHGRAVRWAREGAVLVAIVLGLGAWQTRHHPRGLAPDFALEELGGGGVVTRESLTGRPTMLVFWAPWCTVCKAESSNVSWVQRLAGDRANVVSVAAGYRTRAEVADAVRAQEMDYRVLLGGDELAERLAVGAFPSVYFLDEAGRIRHSATGYTTTLGMVLRLFAPW